MSTAANPAQLRRRLGVFGATMMGLGSIIGTGVFVAIGLAAELAGAALIAAIALAAIVATCNALSSAQLAANYPVSGGTYEYGYRYLHPVLGFTAGWMFLCAKTASAATASLGFAGYLLQMLDWRHPPGRAENLLAVGAVLGLAAIVLMGIRQSNRVNIVIVSITLASLLIFVLTGLPTALWQGRENLTTPAGSEAGEPFWPRFFEATALMFVAYTGYGRIATLGEEVREPHKTIPRAIITTLWFSAALYIAVATVALAAIGAPALGQAARTTAAPLEFAATTFNVPGVRVAIAIGAITAMLGVLLNLILGLSRVLLAMGRRGDMPRAFARLNQAQTTPTLAVAGVGVAIAALALFGGIKATWSFSAFTVLIYYALTNAAAIALPKAQRLYPPFIPAAGLLACLSLAVWVDRSAWISGVALVLAGLVYFLAVVKFRANSELAPPSSHP